METNQPTQQSKQQEHSMQEKNMLEVKSTCAACDKKILIIKGLIVALIAVLVASGALAVRRHEFGRSGRGYGNNQYGVQSNGQYNDEEGSRFGGKRMMGSGRWNYDARIEGEQDPLQYPLENPSQDTLLVQQGAATTPQTGVTTKAVIKQ